MMVLAFGEVLWDIFGEDYQIGGAPYNFCAHLSKLGAQSCLFSAVGRDALGTRTLETVRHSGMGAEFLLRNDFPTGACRVTCDAQGQPAYDLLSDAAYDHIALNAEQLARIRAAGFDVFYFGTLAQRGEISRRTLNEVLGACRFGEIFCDLNLRRPFYTADTIRRCLRAATIFKISREECRLLTETLFADGPAYADADAYYRSFCARLAEQYELKIIILTLDRDGALVYERAGGHFTSAEKPRNRAVSTVGAGDSFSACFLYNYFGGASLSECTARAGALSDFVVTRKGAVPDVPEELLSRIR